MDATHRLMHSRSTIRMIAVVAAAVITVVLRAPIAFAQCGFQPLDTFPGVPPGVPGIQGFGFKSRALAVSADGAAVVGEAWAPNPTYGVTHPFRWTAASGMVDLFPLSSSSAATAVSADGSVVVGNLNVGPYSGGFFRLVVGAGASPLTGFNVRGISGDGAVLVGQGQSCNCAARLVWPSEVPVILDSADGSYAAASSYDGSVIVGRRRVSVSEIEAFRWTASDGMHSLGALPSPTGPDATPTAISWDGSAVVGYSVSEDASSVFGPYEAFRWTEATGMIGLGFLPGTVSNYSRALGISGDGAIVVGTAVGRFDEGMTIFVWTASTGMRRLRDVLTDDCNLDLAGWFANGEQPVAISADGTAIVGTALGPDYTMQAFMARIPRGFADCNHNGKADATELAKGTATDCNTNGRLDVCDIDQCSDDAACADCNGNVLPDGCDIVAGTSLDSNGNGVPDECDDCCTGCDDANVCTADECFNGVCVHIPIRRGDLHPCAGDGVIDVDDVLAVLNAFLGYDECGCLP